MTMFIAIGLGISSACAMLLILLKFNKTSFSINRQKLRKGARLKKHFRMNKKEGYFGLGAGMLFGSFATTVSGILQMFIVGFVLGVIGFRYYDSLRMDVLKGNQLKEMITLFDAVELYMESGYTMFQALESAKDLTYYVAPYIQNCLDLWPTSPKEALNQLRIELSIPEGETLVSLLIYMEKTGSQNMKGALGQEAYSIGRLRKMGVVSSIAKKPILTMIYRFLPIFSTIGIVAGTLVYRMYMIVAEMGIYGF